MEKKDPLLSLIGHELSSPLSACLGNLRLLSTGRLGALSDPQRKLVDQVIVSAERLATLVNQLRDLSRMVAGGTRYTRQPVDLGGLLERALPAVPALPDREVSLTLRNEAPGATVSGDEARLTAAFQGLIYTLRRELVTSDELVVSLRRKNGAPASLQVTIAGSDRIDEVDAPGLELTAFDEFRSGVGLSLLAAHHIFKSHEAEVFSPRVEQPPDEALSADPAEAHDLLMQVSQKRKAAAIVLIPQA